MAIEQLILEPPIAIDWFHRPISTQIKKDKKAKLLVINDIYINDALADAKSKKIVTIPSYNNNRVGSFPELLLRKDIISDDKILNILLESYLDVNKKFTGSESIIKTLLRLMCFASNKVTLGTTLKKWYIAEKSTLSNYISSIERPKSEDKESFERDIKVYSNPVSFDLIKDNLTLLWNLHKMYISSRDSNTKSPILNDGTVIIIPASYLQTNDYFKLIVYFCILRKIEVYFDSDVDITLFQKYLIHKSYKISLSRYSNTRKSTLNFLAPNANNVLSTTQEPDQTLFINWLAYKDLSTVSNISLTDLKRLFSQTPIVTFIGTYLRLIQKRGKDSQIGLMIYNSKDKRWQTQNFNYKLLMKNLLPESNNSSNEKKIAYEHNKNDSHFSDTVIKEIQTLNQQVKQLSTNFNNSLGDLKSDLAGISSNLQNTSEQAEKSEDNLQDNKQVIDALNEIQKKLDKLTVSTEKMPTQITDKINLINQESYNDSSSDEDDIEQLNRKYEAALNDQVIDSKDFDD